MKVTLTKIEFLDRRNYLDDEIGSHPVRDPQRSHAHHVTMTTYSRLKLAEFHCLIENTGELPIQITVPVPYNDNLVEAAKLAKASLLHMCSQLVSEETDFGGLNY